MDFTSELTKFIDEQEVKETNFGSSDAFIIENDKQANYAIRKLKEIKAEKDKISEAAETAINSYCMKVNEFKESKTKELDFRENYFMNLLQHYVETKIEGTKKRSIKFIEGTAGFRKKPLNITYDEPIVLNFLQTHPDLEERFTTTKVTLDKTSLRKLGQIDLDNTFMVDGITIPGITAEQQPDSFNVK